ncbi:hypothetical protein OSB04_001959 [Centaurea solstitialis]|uniref:Uncharacterized protein n=1 Tax=Centaurea solstitialis TaxID=347529 RepID=A0AA38TRY7_9ASTR|nr:hypothetical protein OSB04_001959 [Centaurea solstitialis]
MVHVTLLAPRTKPSRRDPSPRAANQPPYTTSDGPDSSRRDLVTRAASYCSVAFCVASDLDTRAIVAVLIPLATADHRRRPAPRLRVFRSPPSLTSDVCLVHYYLSTRVHGHLTGKIKPASDDDEDWEAIDSRIKSWFYSTCDASLLQIISSDNCTAKDLWDKLMSFF